MRAIAKTAIDPLVYHVAKIDVVKHATERLLKVVPFPRMIYVTVEGAYPAKTETEKVPVRDRLYVSGPMSGYPEFNYPAFREAAQGLRALGYTVEDPSEHFGGSTDLPRHKYLAADVLSLVAKCRGIVLLDGWWDSEGARLEAQIALDLDYEFFRWTNALTSRYGLTPMDRVYVEELLA